MSFKRICPCLLLVLCFISQSGFAQFGVEQRTVSPGVVQNRRRGLNMLEKIKETIKAEFYDKNYHGIDLDAKFKTAAERIKKLDENWQIYRVIGQLIMDFDDSHTRFYPPPRVRGVEYGFSLQMIGKTCYVIDVVEGSDAEEKGLKIGDVVLGIAGFTPARDNLWKINYLFYYIDPQEHLNVTVLDRDKAVKEIEIKAAFKSDEERRKTAQKRRKEKLDDPYKCQAINNLTIACKLRTFSVVNSVIDKMMKEAAGFKNLVLDLRGNGGGYAYERLTGYFFDHDVKICDYVFRNKKDSRIAKTQKENVFKGELVVLIDSNSASASEVFSRFIQLEKRGKIVGDVSAGKVTAGSRFYLPAVGPLEGGFVFSDFLLYLATADLIMSDGNRLEKVGVIPDHPFGPTQQALIRGTDPILAFAAGLVNARLTPEDAGKFYFITRRHESDDDDEESDKATNDQTFRARATPASTPINPTTTLTNR